MEEESADPKDVNATDEAVQHATEDAAVQAATE